jgi:hypothetical protein
MASTCPTFPILSSNKSSTKVKRMLLMDSNLTSTTRILPQAEN